MEKTLLENPYIVSANLKRKLEFDARETVGEKPFRFAKCVITYSRVARNLATTDLSGEKFTGKEGRKEGRTTPHCLSVLDRQMGKRCSCCGEITRPTSVRSRREVA